MDFRANHSTELAAIIIINNGKIVLDIMTENNMIMLNDTDKCKGTYTWSRRQSKSVIDFVLVNSFALGSAIWRSSV